jgi:dihydroorotase
MHVHVFWGTEDGNYLSNSYASLPPDGFTFRSGVTTVVDAGSSGWRNFKDFKEQTIEHSSTRVLAFLNIVSLGMKGGAVEQNLLDMDPKLTAMVARQYKDDIVGIKLAHYSGPDWDPLIRTVEAGVLADIPVMIDFGGHRPHLSLERLFLEELRPGDIFTHCFANVGGRTAIVDENGKVRPYVWEAQKKGIVFDVGHGGGSFVYDQAMPAMEQGFWPNSISTDLHTGSMNAGMKSMLNVMSKLLNMGLPLNEVIKTSTWNPAKYIKHEELGHLSEGAVADIAVLNLEEGNFGFIDVRGQKMKGTQKLECELTILGGKVVYDLNGISMPEWQAGAVNK